MIFPGMDPYLEHPQLWTGVHTRMIVYLCDQLQPLIRPRYVAAIEERVYLEGSETQKVSDAWLRRTKPVRKNGKIALMEADEPLTVQVSKTEVHERYVFILDRQADEKVITVIELVSPSNKRAGPGRDSYVEKQREILHSHSHLIEIDLLRTGNHVVAVPESLARDRAGDYNYLACVNRAAGLRDKFDLYPRKLTERLPRIRVPLTGNDPDVPLDVQELLERVCQDGSYDLRIRYDRPCVPPLAKAEQTWANGLIRKGKASRSRKK